MKNVILLDIDGVLITTPPWRADDIHADGYSDFNSKAVDNLNELLNNVDAEIWLSSTRRINKTLIEFNLIFKTRKISQELKGFIPCGTQGENRLIEVNAFLDHEPIKNFLILDDDNSLQDLSAERKAFWIKTSPLLGFDTDKLNESIERIKNWR